MVGTIPIDGLPFRHLALEASFFIAADGCGIERKDFYFHPVEVEFIKGVIDENAQRIGAIATPPVSRGADHDPNSAEAIPHVRSVQDTLTDQPVIGKRKDGK